MEIGTLKHNVLTGACGLTIVGFFAAPLVFVSHTNCGPGIPSCLSNIKQMALAMLLYSGDNDDRLPMADTWIDAEYPYTKNWEIYRDSDALPKGQFGYAFLNEASGLNENKVKEPQRFPLVFDSSMLGKNSHSELNTLPFPGRHAGQDNIGYLDGRASQVPMPRAD